MEKFNRVDGGGGEREEAGSKTRERERGLKKRAERCEKEEEER